jgi:hypothetical protein
VFPVLRELEAQGLVRRRPDRYVLTRRGHGELAMARSVARLVARAG